MAYFWEKLCDMTQSCITRLVGIYSAATMSPSPPLTNAAPILVKADGRAVGKGVIVRKILKTIHGDTVELPTYFSG
jgi:hypothetical protein